MSPLAFLLPESGRAKRALRRTSLCSGVMSSPTRMREREEERRLSIRTLAIASFASAAAAIITSRVWTAGTPIAAAVTPVIVALVSELLHRPSQVIAQRLTTERTAILPEAAGAGPPPPPDADRLSPRAPAEPGTQPASPVTVYRREPRRGRSRRRIALGVVVTTAVLAFAIGAAALTIPELIGGGSLTKGNRDTTLFGGHKKQKSTDEAPAQTAPETRQTAPETTPTQTETTPTETETAPTETQTAPSKTPTTPAR
jgi:hypothetical protein